MTEIQVRVIFDKVDEEITGADVLEIVARTLGVSPLAEQDVDTSRIKVTAVKAIPKWDRATIEKSIVTGRESQGLGWSTMANRFNSGGVPTLGSGAQWYASTIKAVYERTVKNRSAS